jgi:hypothetical protein
MRKCIEFSKAHVLGNAVTASDLDDSGRGPVPARLLAALAGAARRALRIAREHPQRRGRITWYARTRFFRVLVDVRGHRIEAGFHAPSTEKPVLFALRLREEGWDPYRVLLMHC